jgi:hypothetical protein
VNSPIYAVSKKGFKPAEAPVAQLTFEVKNARGEPVSYRFAGCKSASIRVIDELGQAVLESRTDDGGCCACKSILQVELDQDMLAFSTGLRLVQKDGMPLPNGRYAVVVVLDTLGSPSLRPAASAEIELKAQP